MAALATTRVATPVISELRRAWLSCMERTILFRRGAVRAGWPSRRAGPGRGGGAGAGHHTGPARGSGPRVAYGTAVVCVPAPAKCGAVGAARRGTGRAAWRRTILGRARHGRQRRGLLRPVVVRGPGNGEAPDRWRALRGDLSVLMNRWDRPRDRRRTIGPNRPTACVLRVRDGRSTVRVGCRAARPRSGAVGRRAAHHYRR